MSLLSHLSFWIDNQKPYKNARMNHFSLYQSCAHSISSVTFPIVKESTSSSNRRIVERLDLVLGMCTQLSGEQRSIHITEIYRCGFGSWNRRIWCDSRNIISRESNNNNVSMFISYSDTALLMPSWLFIRHQIYARFIYLWTNWNFFVSYIVNKSKLTKI